MFVLSRADEIHADLIVLSESRHTKADLRAILERAACSVLIVRDKSTAGAPAAAKASSRRRRWWTSWRRSDHGPSVQPR